MNKDHDNSSIIKLIFFQLIEKPKGLSVEFSLANQCPKKVAHLRSIVKICRRFFNPLEFKSLSSCQLDASFVK